MICSSIRHKAEVKSGWTTALTQDPHNIITEWLQKCTFTCSFPGMSFYTGILTFLSSCLRDRESVNIIFKVIRIHHLKTTLSVSYFVWNHPVWEEIFPRMCLNLIVAHVDLSSAQHKCLYKISRSSSQQLL